MAVFALNGVKAEVVAVHGLRHSTLGASVSLVERTPLRWAIEAASPVVGAGRSPGGGAVAIALGLPPPRAYAVVPIAMPGGIVGLAYVDGGPKALSLAEVGAAFRFCERVLEGEPMLNAGAHRRDRRRPPRRTRRFSDAVRDEDGRDGDRSDPTSLHEPTAPASATTAATAGDNDAHDGHGRHDGGDAHGSEGARDEDVAYFSALVQASMAGLDAGFSPASAAVASAGRPPGPTIVPAAEPPRSAVAEFSAELVNAESERSAAAGCHPAGAARAVTVEDAPSPAAAVGLDLATAPGASGTDTPSATIPLDRAEEPSAVRPFTGPALTDAEPFAAAAAMAAVRRGAPVPGEATGAGAVESARFDVTEAEVFAAVDAAVVDATFTAPKAAGNTAVAARSRAADGTGGAPALDLDGAPATTAADLLVVAHETRGPGGSPAPQIETSATEHDPRATPDAIRAPRSPSLSVAGLPRGIPIVVSRPQPGTPSDPSTLATAWGPGCAWAQVNGGAPTGYDGRATVTFIAPPALYAEQVAVVTPGGVVSLARARRPAGPWRVVSTSAATLATVVAVVLTLVAPASPPAPARNVVIAPQTSLGSVARELEAAGLVRSAVGFEWLARLSGNDRSLRAGSYQLSPGAWAWEQLRALTGGQVDTVTVTVPEGLTLREVAVQLEAQGVARAKEFLAAASSRELLERYELPGPTAEGYLFPETYTFATGLPAREIVETMVREFFVRLGSIPAAAGAGSQTLAERVVLASIVEREARDKAELSRIAGVFQNRLDRNLKLESCATVQYVLGRRKERLSLADVRRPSPYNTYLRLGLPPAPIGNPGLPALRAAFAPERHDLLFFFARDDGTHRHVFNRTYTEHLSAQRRLLARRD